MSNQSSVFAPDKLYRPGVRAAARPVRMRVFAVPGGTLNHVDSSWWV